MRLRRQTWMSVGLAFVLAGGCATRGTVEELESQLREHEDRIYSLQNELSKARGELEVARRENTALRLQMSPQGGLVEEQSAVLARVEKIRFHPLLTSGVDADGRPGDERLTVLLMPVDRDGELLRLPGNVELELFDMSLPAERQRIGRWVFSPQETRSKWQRALLSAGYHFEMEWQEPPQSAELTLHGRLTAADGRQFDTTSQVKVRLPASGLSPPVSDHDEPAARPAARRSPTPWKRDPQTRRVSRPISDADRDAPPVAPPGLPQTPTITSDRFTEPEIPALR